MNDQFDPYYKWLSIPPRDQPPDHYRLLGLGRYECDAEAIANAADQRMGFLRTFQVGRHSADSQRILNEVARARVTLLDPARKAAYDAVLRSAAPADAAPTPQAAPGRPTPPVQPPPVAVAGEGFPRFRLAECLQQTPLASIYRAEDVRTGRSYSLKLLSPQAAANSTFRKRFRREIDIATRIDHPNLIAGYEAGEHQGVPYLVTEYVVGADLQTLVVQRGSMPVEHAAETIIQAARGLMQLHCLGVYHRNISPRNLLVDIQGQIKVTNFLLAKFQDGSEWTHDEEELTRMGDIMGTAEFLAPEQAMDPKGVDHRADIYSLGCTLFFLVVGRAVYPGRSLMDKLAAHRTQPIPSLRNLCGAPDWLDRVFRKMVAKDPAGRFGSMADVSEALTAARRPSWWSRCMHRVHRLLRVSSPAPTTRR